MRKHILLLPILALFGACSTSNNQEDPLDKLSIQLDTVMIDTGDDIIDLRSNLYNAQLSEDNRYLYNLISYGDPSLEIIDLDELKLVRSSPLEKDGPNGIPQYLNKFYVTNTGDLLLLDYRFYKVFNLDGKVINDLALEKIAPELLNGFDNYPNALIDYPNNPNKKILMINNWQSMKYTLLQFDLTTKSFQEISLNGLDKLNDYRTKIMINGMDAGGMRSRAIASYGAEKIVISNDAFNEIQIYDMSKDTLYIKDLTTTLLGSKRSFIPPKEIERDAKLMNELIKSVDEDLKYGKFIWDAASKNFFRFSSKENFNGEQNENGRFISTSADVYLSIFDEDFNLLAEALIPELNKVPGLHFIKDGKIWLFENMNDEVAFIRIDLSENKL